MEKVKLKTERKLSFSKFSVVDNCPRQFLLQYIEKNPRGPTHPDTLLGKAVHNTYEKWFKDRMKGDMDYLQKLGKSEFYGALKKEGLVLDVLKEAILLEWLDHSIPTLYNLLHDNGQIHPKTMSEIEITLYKDDILFSGAIDFFTPTSKTTAIISDAKATKNLDYLKMDQIKIYAYMMHKSMGIQEFHDCGYLCFHPQTSKMVPVDIDLKEAKEIFEHKVSKYKQVVKEGLYPATPEYMKCYLCDMYDHCQDKIRIPKRENNAILELVNTKQGTKVQF